MSQLTEFTWPDLSHWTGLSPASSLADVRAEFIVPQDSYGSGYLGDDSRKLSWLYASSSRFPEPLRVWFSGEQVTAIETDILGKREDLEALAKKLGEPAARFDSYFGNARMPGSEWVYPQIGLTLYVEPELRTPLRVAVYPATTLEDYRKNYRLVLKPSVKARRRS